MFGYLALAFVLGALAGGAAVFVWHKKVKAGLEEALAKGKELAGEAEEKFDEVKDKVEDAIDGLKK